MKSSKCLEHAALPLALSRRAVLGTSTLRWPARPLGLPGSHSLDQRLGLGGCLGIPRPCRKG